MAGSACLNVSWTLNDRARNHAMYIHTHTHTHTHTPQRTDRGKGKGTSTSQEGGGRETLLSGVASSRDNSNPAKTCHSGWEDTHDKSPGKRNHKRQDREWELQTKMAPLRRRMLDKHGTVSSTCRSGLERLFDCVAGGAGVPGPPFVSASVPAETVECDWYSCCC